MRLCLCRRTAAIGQGFDGNDFHHAPDGKGKDIDGPNTMITARNANPVAADMALVDPALRHRATF
nr:hypothetical protein [Aurantiacibacter marinus]